MPMKSDAPSASDDADAVPINLGPSQIEWSPAGDATLRSAWALLLHRISSDHATTDAHISMTRSPAPGC